MNVAFDRDTNTSGTIPEIAKSFKARNQPWALVVDDNYGEGSAREHAALQPRFYGEANCFISLLDMLRFHRLCFDPCKVICSDSRNKPQSQFAKFHRGLV